MKYLLFVFILSTFLQNTDHIIFDSSTNDNLSNWWVVDDGVMGGLSKGNIELNEDGDVVYKGYVTTENNGGFSSVRYNLKRKNLEQYKFIVLKIKGDGKRYQFRLKKNRFDRFTYIQYFETNGQWQVIKIPLDSFYPSFRGFKLNRPNFDGTFIEEIAFLIGNKKKESFELIIDSIALE